MTRAIVCQSRANDRALLWALGRSDTRLQGEVGGIQPAGVPVHWICVRRPIACGWIDGAWAALDPAGPKIEPTAKGRGEVRHA